MEKYTQIANCVINGEDDQILALIQAQLDAGESPLDILNHGLVAGMSQVSELFKTEDLCLPEVLMAAEAMNAGMELIRPLLGDVELETKATILMGTMQGDLHDIGRNLVAMVLETAGYKVINLGCDVSPDTFVEKIREYQPQIVGMSALLTTSMTFMGTAIEAIQAAGLRDQVKVIIGGAPTSWEFANKIGADGYSDDATGAVELCNRLLA